MSSYVKIWTDIRNDEWFISLRLIERGLWYELLCLAKQRGDCGRFFLRSRRTLAAEVGGDDSTVTRILGIFRHTGKVFVEDLPSGNIEITIPKYQYWQELTKDEIKDVVAKNRRKAAEKSPSSEQIRSEQSRPDQSNIPFSEIIGHLNGITGKHYKSGSDSIQQLIRARWGEGWRVPDFEHVHSVKAEEWIGTEMAIYVRPSTLYRKSHFEEYRNQVADPLKGQSDLGRRNAIVAANYLRKEREKDERRNQAIGNRANDSQVVAVIAAPDDRRVESRVLPLPNGLRSEHDSPGDDEDSGPGEAIPDDSGNA
jgi:uncharacterized phage protein (TIGR02220 family)